MAKSIDTAMVSHLQGEVQTIARCAEIRRRDGVVHYFTSLDKDLVVNGQTYKALGGFTDSALTVDPGLAVNNLELTGVFNSSDLTETDLRSGLYDYAEVRFYAVNWAQPSQVVKLANGFLGEVTVTPSGVFLAELRSLKQLYQQNVGSLFSPTCRADLGDSRCKVDLGPLTFTETVLVANGADNRGFTMTNSNASAVDGWYNEGVLTWLTGRNAGRSIEVKAYANATCVLYLPMPQPITAGDTFRIYPGCDKSWPTCKDRYHNIVNMRAEPYLPGTDALTQTGSAVTG